MKKDLLSSAHTLRFHWMKSSRRGQTTIFVVLGLGLVMLAVLGFAIDFGNMWFHRQSAQNAADASCTAAVMDMYYNVNVSGGTLGGFPSPLSSFDCSSGSTAAACQYANFNGYNSSGLTASASNKVHLDFPGTPDCSSTPSDPLCSIPTCTFPITNPNTVCIPPASYLANPFVKVTVTDRIPVGFFRLVGARATMDVPAKATCGLVLTTSPIPLIVLDPTRRDTMELDGGSGLKIWGGPPVSIQVNSINAAAYQQNGNNGQIDLSLGGPIPTGGSQPTGSAMHVAVTQTSPPSPISNASTCVPPPGGAALCVGTTGSYGNHLPILDPFAYITAPSQPTWTGSAPQTNGNSFQVKSDRDAAGTVADPKYGCPAPSGQFCKLYMPGYYATGINAPNGEIAIFAPGIYYIKNGLTAGSNTCLRPATIAGDGSGGTFFYFADNSSLNVTGGGCNSGGSSPIADAFLTKSGTGAYSNGMACDATGLVNLPANIPDSISGSVLLAPCTEPNAANSMCVPNCTINASKGFGDPAQPGDATTTGVQRGLLFMQNRHATINNAANMPKWQGGGAFLLSGTMYFHQCNTGNGTDLGGSGCTTSAFTDQLTIGGNSSSASYVLGDIIVDQLKINGTPNLYMDLSPNSLYPTFKASLLQ